MVQAEAATARPTEGGDLDDRRRGLDILRSDRGGRRRRRDRHFGPRRRTGLAAGRASGLSRPRRSAGAVFDPATRTVRVDLASSNSRGEHGCRRRRCSRPGSTDRRRDSDRVRRRRTHPDTDSPCSALARPDATGSCPGPQATSLSRRGSPRIPMPRRARRTVIPCSAHRTKVKYRSRGGWSSPSYPRSRARRYTHSEEWDSGRRIAMLWNPFGCQTLATVTISRGRTVIRTRSRFCGRSPAAPRYLARMRSVQR